MDTELERLLGIPLPLLNRICCGRQGRLADLLTAPPNEIQDLLTDLFDLNRCETLRKALKNQLDTVADMPDQLYAEHMKQQQEKLAALEPDDDLEARRKTLEEQLRRVDADVLALREKQAG